MLQWTLVPSYFCSLFLYLVYLHLIDQFKPFQLLSDGCVRGCSWVCMGLCSVHRCDLVWAGEICCLQVCMGVCWYAWVCIGCALGLVFDDFPSFSDNRNELGMTSITQN